MPGPLATATVIVSPGFTVVGNAVTLGPGGVSSLVMMHTPWLSPICAFVGNNRLTKKVSLGSIRPIDRISGCRRFRSLNPQGMSDRASGRGPDKSKDARA